MPCGQSFGEDWQGCVVIAALVAVAVMGFPDKAFKTSHSVSQEQQARGHPTIRLSAHFLGSLLFSDNSLSSLGLAALISA
mmetsp:Transcript_21209/g.58196  ORF Transcript_21209/g.58196 Transcript_21209/m.58196 type:complete len:80 (-) Transcript_21209:1810-2049(-)|eukprot:scaffold288827_cov32-Tisochrysis_lutea.AAC.1